MRDLINLVEGYSNPEYQFVTTCEAGGHGPMGEAIHIMTDDAIEISYKQFENLVSKDQLEDVFPNYNWTSSSKNGLRLKDDYAMKGNFFKARWYGIECVYCVWSAIEFIFTKNGDTPESMGIDRDNFIYDHELNESVVGEPSDILTRKVFKTSFYEDYDELLDSLVYNYNNGYQNKWKVIPATLLKSIWIDHQKMGFVRNTKGLDKIVKQFTYNIKMLNIFTDISGHSTHMPDELSEHFPDDEEKEKFVDWAIEADTGWRISDYGMQPLIKYAMLLEECDTDEEKLLVCDAILNVVHQRSDLASWFVEGGSRTLSELSN